jgi:hypothetical protein
MSQVGREEARGEMGDRWRQWGEISGVNIQLLVLHQSTTPAAAVILLEAPHELHQAVVAITSVAVMVRSDLTVPFGVRHLDVDHSHPRRGKKSHTGSETITMVEVVTRLEEDTSTTASTIPVVNLIIHMIMSLNFRNQIFKDRLLGGSVSGRLRIFDTSENWGTNAKNGSSDTRALHIAAALNMTTTAEVEVRFAEAIAKVEVKVEVEAVMVEIEDGVEEVEVEEVEVEEVEVEEVEVEVLPDPELELGPFIVRRDVKVGIGWTWSEAVTSA